MTEHTKMNMKNDPEYRKSLWKCDDCGKQDSNQHLLWCSGFEEEREDLDLSVEKDLANYLIKLHKKRHSRAKQKVK